MVGISRNFTDEKECPFFVVYDELEERMDLAGVAFEAVEDCDGDRPRIGLRHLSRASPRIAT